jgi:hypothetical protein
MVRQGVVWHFNRFHDDGEGETERGVREREREREKRGKERGSAHGFLPSSP